MIRTLCVATVVMGLAVGLAVPALRPSRGTQLPVLMSGPSRGPRFSAGVDGVPVPGGVKPGVGTGDGTLESPTGAPTP